MDDDQHDRLRGGNGRYTRDPATAAFDARAAELRAQAYSYRQIATELGCHPSTAHDAVQRAMAEVVAEPAAAAVQFELERLDRGLRRLEEARDHVQAVLAREHVTVSQGRVVYMDNGEAVPDDDWILKAVDRLIRIEDAIQRNGESRRRLLGLDSPTKTSVSGGLTYEIVGVDAGDLA
ncbi:helix-turn-helix domain-containing protein [Kitasatospora sp. NPDC048298]|uniref:helix-turn-helix domain-containing protein n=1 Tax=Kitasatospora sp. NPDC048298 TaxID=3364049 RepID=UPI00371C870A